MEQYVIRTSFGRKVTGMKCTEKEALSELEATALKLEERLYLFRIEPEEKRQVFVTRFPQ